MSGAIEPVLKVRTRLGPFEPHVEDQVVKLIEIGVAAS